MNLDAVAAAQSRVEATLAAMTDSQAGEPSRLHGWTRAMVAAHIALNASSNADMVAAALRGERRPQYPGGPSQRAEEIEAARGRSAAALLDEVRTSNARWLEVFGSVGEHQWSLLVPAGVGDRPISQRVTSRLLEVEVHHADLGLGYTFRDWPLEFVAEALPDAVRRAPDRGLLAWLLGRESIESADLASLPERFPFP